MVFGYNGLKAGMAKYLLDFPLALDLKMRRIPGFIVTIM
jgi:hypothetical protein